MNNKDIVLSKRMKAVVDMVPPHSSNIADVGCDHAYVSIYLKKERNVKHVIAMDVRKGPLQIARNNIELYGESPYIETRLSDGLEKLIPGEADTIIIAGMGGLLIKEILYNGAHILNALNPPVLVLQPQSDLREVRIYLFSISYHIKQETVMMEEGKYYTVILAVPGEEKCYESEEDLVYGKYNLDNKSKILAQYLENEEIVFRNILSGLYDEYDKKKNFRIEKRISEIEEKLCVNRAAYERCVNNEM